MMDTQSLASAVLVLPAVVLALVALPARRRDRTRFGLELRHGGTAELLRGMAFSVPFLVLLVLVTVVTGLAGPAPGRDWVVPVVGIAVYFLVLFLLEEVVFRSLLMTGLGVVAGRSVALLLTAVLVAAPYAFTPHTGVLPLLGAVVTNLLTGWARWRSGRIWWGLGQRWVWNTGAVALGFTDSAFSLTHPALDLRLHGPAWLTGGSFGIEGGVVGILFLVAMAAGVSRFAHGRRGPWVVRPAADTTSTS